VQISKPVVIGMIGAAAIVLFQIILHLRRAPIHKPIANNTSSQRVQRMAQKLGFESHERMNFLPVCPVMTRQMKLQLESKLNSEAWTKGRKVVVNEESNTISLFDIDDGTDVVQPLETVPLSYDNIPVIPHSFQFGIPKVSRLKDFRDIETITPRDGLYQFQIKELCSYFPGISTVDFFLDRVVVITFLNADFHQQAVEKTHTERFRAFGCLIYFGLLAGAVSDRLIRGPRTTKEQAISVVGDNFIPGCRVYNEADEFSRIGTFLHPTSIPFLHSLNVAHFTLSAHSFMKKRSIDIGLNGTFAFLAPFSIHFAYIMAENQMWSEFLAVQVVVFQLLLWAYILLCKYAGSITKIHNIVNLILKSTDE
jgi:hypothetical protein